jgi:hypothetical protein
MMLVTLATPSLFDFLARDDRSLAVHGTARFLSSRRFAMRNGIAGEERHIDRVIVLSLLRVLAHDQLLSASSFLKVFYFKTVKQKLGFREKRWEPHIGHCVLTMPLELSETASHGSFSLNWGAWAQQALRAHLSVIRC